MVEALGALESNNLGVELTPDRINIAEIHKQGQALKLVTLASKPLPEGLYRQGQIIDPPGIAELLQSLLREYKIKAKRIATAVTGGQDTVTRIIPIPAELNDQELREMVLNQEVGLYLPFPREEADIDYQKLGFFVDEDGIEKVRVLLVATRKEVTDSYINTFQQAGLNITVLETSSFSVFRTIRDQLRQFTPQEAAAIVDIEFENTEISIVLDGVPQFSRTVPIGTYQIQTALSRAMNLPPSRNTDLLQGMTIPATPVDSVTDTPPKTGGTNPGTAAMLRILGELADELRRSIDFYLNQGDNLKVAQLLLAGPGGSIGQLDEFFSQRLSIPCNLIDPITTLGLEVPDEIMLTQRSGLSVVLGLACDGVMRYGLDTNFLRNRSEYRPETTEREDFYMSNIDPYLIHSFDVERKRAMRLIEEGAEQNLEEILQPMLIRVNDSLWEPTEIPDFQMTSRMGYIVGCLGTWRTIEALSNDPDVLSIEASRYSSNAESYQSLSFTKADKIHQIPEKGDMALIAIIDTGIDVLHEVFLDKAGKQTRILAIWDQTDNTGPRPNIPGLKKPYGTEHKFNHINQYIQNQQVPSGLGRDAISNRSASGHGTHVISIAAGRPFANSPGGIAPEAKIVVVKTRGEYVEGEPFSLGYSVSHLDALTYIKHIAKEEKLPVVVNLSQGMNAGAHDGTSNLETAFDEFTKGGREPGYVIVKSAGNERGEKVHALVRMANDTSDELIWESTKDHWGPDVIELWFKSCDELQFRLTNPSGDASPWISRSNKSYIGQFQTGDEYRLTYLRYHYDNGDSQLAINVSQSSYKPIEQGRWVLEIQSGNVQSGEIHAWIERASNRPINFINHVNDDITLSIPGTARTVIAVASVRLSKPFRPSNFSSLGPTRDGRSKPDLAAPGESINAAQAGSISGVKNDSGTSMAAPHVTGAIALLLSKREKQRLKQPKLNQFNAAQIQSALSQTTQNYGNWVSGMGYGVLDIEEFLNVLD